MKSPSWSTSSSTRPPIVGTPCSTSSLVSGFGLAEKSQATGEWGIRMQCLFANRQLHPLSKVATALPAAVHRPAPASLVPPSAGSPRCIARAAQLVFAIDGLAGSASQSDHLLTIRRSTVHPANQVERLTSQLATITRDPPRASLSLCKCEGSRGFFLIRVYRDRPRVSSSRTDGDGYFVSVP